MSDAKKCDECGELMTLPMIEVEYRSSGQFAEGEYCSWTCLLFMADRANDALAGRADVALAKIARWRQRHAGLFTGQPAEFVKPDGTPADA